MIPKLMYVFLGLMLYLNWAFISLTASRNGKPARYGALHREALLRSAKEHLENHTEKLINYFGISEGKGGTAHLMPSSESGRRPT
jgi:hypothetical protein